MKIDFECKKCQKEFDCEMGKIGINETTMRPDFEKPIVCPRCGAGLNTHLTPGVMHGILRSCEFMDNNFRRQ